MTYRKQSYDPVMVWKSLNLVKVAGIEAVIFTYGARCFGMKFEVWEDRIDPDFDTMIVTPP